MVGITKLSLANRVLVALLTIAVTVTGVFAATSMRVEFFPSMNFPMAFVSATYPGASPEVVEQEVAVPIETAVSSIDGVERVDSTSSNSMAWIDVTFDLDVDGDDAADAIQREVLGLDLPDDVDTDIFSGADGGGDVVLAMAASADEDAETLSDNLATQVVPELEGLPGVSRVDVFGEQQEFVEIDPDEDELEDEGLTVGDIAELLESNGVVLPGGALVEGDRTLSVNVGREFDSLEDLEDLYLMPAGAGPLPEIPGAAPDDPEPVRLGDVADLSWTVDEPQTLSRVNGDNGALSIIVYKSANANTVDVSHAVRDAAPDLADELGADGQLIVTVDTAPFIEDSIEGLVEKGLVGLVIAVALILVFLLSLRTTIVTAVSIPLSLLMALIALWWGGYTLNMMTLAALTVAIGRVVDDSIVVLENIKRHLSYGTERLHAITTGVREVAGAITASTLTTAAVFLPVTFIGGQVGELFRPFGVTVAVALLSSLLVALTIIPVLAYWFVHTKPVPPEERERVRQEAERRELRTPLQRGYVPLLTWVTRRGTRGWPTWRRWATLGAGLLVFLATIGLVSGLRFTFLEDGGQNQLQVIQELPAGTSLSATDEVAHDVEDVLSDIPEVESYETTVGSSGGFGASSSNQATYMLTVDPDADVDAVRDLIDERLSGLDDAGEITVASLLSDGAGGEDTVDVRLLGSDDTALQDGVTEVEDMLTGIDGVERVTSDLAAEEPGIEVVPDSEDAAEHGLSDAQIAQAAQAAFDGQHIGSALVDGSEHHVVISTGEPPTTLTELREYEISAPGGTVELGDVAEIEEVERPVQIVRSDGERSVTVSATVDGDDLGTIGTEVNEALDGLDLPAGVSVDVGGTAEEQQEAMTELLLAIGASIVIVFLIMVAEFRSLAQPLILLVSIPFASTGAIAALLLTDMPMSVSSMIGLLMLVGIVVTNAIVLIDLINQYRTKGMPLREAVVEGGRKRLRPIIMTALATIGALSPMALGLGTSSVFVGQSMAMVVIGGLVSSTVLTLVIVPALYMMVEEGKERRAERRRIRRARRARRRGEPVTDETGAPDEPAEPGDGEEWEETVDTSTSER